MGANQSTDGAHEALNQVEESLKTVRVDLGV